MGFFDNPFGKKKDEKAMTGIGSIPEEGAVANEDVEIRAEMNEAQKEQQKQVQQTGRSVKRITTLNIAGVGATDLSAVPEELLAALAEFDLEDNGELNKSDIIKAAEMYRESKNQAKRLSRIVWFFAALLLFSFGSMTRKGEGFLLIIVEWVCSIGRKNCFCGNNRNSRLTDDDRRLLRFFFLAALLCFGAFISRTFSSSTLLSFRSTNQELGRMTASRAERGGHVSREFHRVCAKQLSKKKKK